MQYKVKLIKAQMEQIYGLPQMYYSAPEFNPYLYPFSKMQTTYPFMFYWNAGNQEGQNLISLLQNRSINSTKSSDSQLLSSFNSYGTKQYKKLNKNNELKGSINKKLIDEQFEIEIEGKKNGVMYKKKNTQSNIVNQIISFINSQRSIQILTKILQANQNKVKDFYRIMLSIKKANKKYVNRKYLKRLIDFDQTTQFQRIYYKCKNISISKEEVKMAIRKLSFYFLRFQSIICLSTSAKIYKDTLSEHFWRKREILNYLFQNEPKQKMENNVVMYK